MTAWNESAYPADSLLISDIPLTFRQIQFALSDLWEDEHTVIAGDYGTGGTITGAEHREGSAKAFHRATEPAYKPEASESVALAAADAGRLWIDSDDNHVYFYSGSAWVDLETALATFTQAMNIAGTLEIDDTLTIVGNNAAVVFDEADQADPEGQWRIVAAGGNLVIQDRNDADAAWLNGIVLNREGNVQLGSTTAGANTRELGGLADPTSAQNAATKAYADANIAGTAVDARVLFGSRDTTDTVSDPLAVNQVYYAECDGFITIQTTGQTGVGILFYLDQVDGTTLLFTNSGPSSVTDRKFVTLPIMKGDYFKWTISGGATQEYACWVPFGTGGLVAQ
jgi:hypothetical protein